MDHEYLLRLYYTAVVFCFGPNDNLEDPCILNDIDFSANENLELAKEIAAIPLHSIVAMLPLYIASPSRLSAHIKSQGYGIQDYAALIMAIISIRQAGKNTKEKLDSTYSAYCQSLQTAQISPISKGSFLIIAREVLNFDIDLQHTEISLGYQGRNRDGELFVAKSTDSVYAAISLLSNKLRYDKNKRIEFVADCFDGLSLSDLTECYDNGSFALTNTDEDILSIMAEVRRKVMSSSPLEILKRLHVSKITEYFTKDFTSGESVKLKTPHSIATTNIPIERGVIYDSIVAHLQTGFIDTVVLFEPSPFLVEQYLSNPLTEIETIIIHENKDECYLFELQYENPEYCGFVRDNVRFLDSEEFDEEIEIGRIEWDSAVACICHNGSYVTTRGNISAICRSGCKRIIVTGPDAIIRESIEHLAPVSILMLPTLGNGTPYQSVAMTTALSEEKDTVFVYSSSSSSRSNENSGIKSSTITYQGKRNITEISDPSRSLRDILRYDNDNNRKRNAPRIVNFSPEICFFVSVPSSTDAQGYLRGKAYIKKQTDGNSVIRESIVNYRVKPEDLETWIHNYPCKKYKVRETGNLVSVQSLISNEIKKHYCGIPVSYRTAVFLAGDKIKEYIQSSYIPMMKELIISEVGDLNPGYMNAEAITDAITGAFPSASDEWVAKANEILIILSKVESDFGFLQKKPFENIISAWRDYIVGKTNISKQLTRRSFDLAQNQQLSRAILSSKTISEYVRIALVLRLVFGMELEVICALTHKDIITCDDLTQIRINKKLSNDGALVQALDRSQQVRIIPCTEMVEELVVAIISDQSNGDTPLIHDGSFNYIAPRVLRKTCKDFLQEQGIEDNYILMHKVASETCTLNLSQLSVDPWRGNFSLLARRYGSLFEDEVNYVLGLQRTTTLGKHYIDFADIRAQIRIREDLQLIENLIISKKNECRNKIYSSRKEL